MYIKSGSDIKRINIYELQTEGNTTQETVITIEGLQTYDYDVDSNNLYVYATKGSNTYLYSITINGVIEGENYEQCLLGVYDNADSVVEE